MASESILSLHEEIFSYLAKLAKENLGFFFTLRRSDRSNKLSRGYYFIGDDHYLSVSFWSGTNWENMCPNINFVIVPSEKKTFLEIVVSESDMKERFVNEFIVPKIPLYLVNGRLVHDIQGPTFIEALDNFIRNEKQIIDEAVRENPDFFGSLDNENRIAFLAEKQFIYRLLYVHAIREDRLEKKNIDRGVYLNSLKINHFGAIEKTGFSGLQTSRWIFLTGENGGGKTSILRSLTLALLPRTTLKSSFQDPGHYKIQATIQVDGKYVELIANAQQPNFDQELLVRGFAAYGASRLVVGDQMTISKTSTAELKIRQEASYSIFHHDGILYDFSSVMRKLILASGDALGREKLDIIVETLIECIDPLAAIMIEGLDDHNADLSRLTCHYVEKDHNGNRFAPVTFQQLSTGTKSLIAMIGDMMVRLFEQQPDVYDVAALRGIVLIDEIDIHFHPSQQVNLVKMLTKSFPKIQFIVSTHSPIPLLGAPKDSVIIRVRREVDKGIVTDRIDTLLDFSNLLPNTILTSPIFGMRSVLPYANQNISELRTERSYNKLKFNDTVKSELRKVYRKLQGDL